MIVMTGASEMKKRIKLIVSYDGTNYAGWQIQDNAVTVEGCLQEALDRLVCRVMDKKSDNKAYNDIEKLSVSVIKDGVELNRIIGASRTDSGVHAMGNVAVFDTIMPIPAKKYAYALNAELPDDIRVISSCEVGEDFHPRYTSSHKTYEYRILNTDIEIPLYSRYTHHVYDSLDPDAMREAAKMIVGEHDFSAFCSAGAQVKTKVRTVEKLEIEHMSDGAFLSSDKNENPGVITIRITGNGFLYNMVRIIAGTLIEVGQHRRTIGSVAEAIESKDRSLAGPTAPAKGLTLVNIRYDNLYK